MVRRLDGGGGNHPAGAWFAPRPRTVPVLRRFLGQPARRCRNHVLRQGCKALGDVASGILPDVEGGIPAARKEPWPYQCLTNIPQRYVLREVSSAGLEARALRQAGCLPLHWWPAIGTAPLPIFRPLAKPRFDRIIFHVLHQPNLFFRIAN